MLRVKMADGQAQAVAAGGAIPAAAIWLDLLDPTEAERAAVQACTGLRVPERAEIAEIERSSRLRTEHDALYLSMPMVSPSAGGHMTTPLGLVLSRSHLITLRFAEMPVVDHVAAEPDDRPAIRCSTGALVGLLEAIVDRLADVLEHVADDLDGLSRRIFNAEGGIGVDGTATTPRRRRHEDAILQATLRRIGVAGDLISRLRASLLGIGRIVPYVAETAAEWLPAPLAPHFVTLRQDVQSLADFDVQLTGKTQFLLDATLGFLNIEQNNGLKVLTVVSVVGIPPTLIASIYGMNFKDMPELGWAYGYPYGLAVILLSIVVPLIWFRLKGWL